MLPVEACNRCTKAPKTWQDTMKAELAKEKHRPFVADIQEIHRRAREHMENGAVTEGHKADRETIIRVLTESIAAPRA